MENKKTMWSGKMLRKQGVAAALLLAALSLSACVVAERGDHGDWRRHHQWNNDGDWHGGPDGGAGWQGNGGGWNHR